MYKTILFDIDGVLLSEERYFDASALTVYELICSPRFLGAETKLLPPYSPVPSEEEIQQIRSEVFVQDTVLELMKSKGINANWDMVYLQFVTQLLYLSEADVGVQEELRLQFGSVVEWTPRHLQELGAFFHSQPNFATFTERFQACEDKQALFDELRTWYTRVFGNDGATHEALHSIWRLGQEAFQGWYLGQAYYPNQPEAKLGFVTNEVPLASPDAISKLFQTCVERGVVIGVATGRPEIETQVPFETYGWSKWFSPLRITTASDVLQAEKEHPEYRPLAKPNPFCYLRSLYESPDALEVLELKRPLPAHVADNLLIVGDSVADLLAAKSIGCHFAAVLTGLTGVAARQQFEDLESDYIWNDVTELHSLLTE